MSSAFRYWTMAASTFPLSARASPRLEWAVKLRPVLARVWVQRVSLVRQYETCRHPSPIRTARAIPATAPQARRRYRHEAVSCAPPHATDRHRPIWGR